jgi:hypothetical protein
MEHMQLPFLQTVEQMVDAYLAKNSYRDRYERTDKYNFIVLMRVTEDGDVHVMIIPKDESILEPLRVEWNEWFLEYGEGNLESSVEFLSDYMWEFKV